MAETAAFVAVEREPGDKVRLRTLIVLRWMAVTGQIAAIAVVHVHYMLSLPIGACVMAVALSVITNLVLSVVYPESRRLSDLEAMALLLFDLAQLSLLIFLTGGLNNPFALLIIAPVVISASALALRTTVLLGIAAILLVTLTAFWHLPLHFTDGTVLAVPHLFEFGFWLSIVIGIVFLGLYSHRVSTEIRVMSDALLATQMALAREQKLTDLGGVIAAAAHELGTPLATIKLASTELIADLASTPELREDARLIRDQADRCRDILRSMGRTGKDDLHLRRAPVETILREAADPHLQRGRAVIFGLSGEPAPRPEIARRPEVIHGLRNLIQNAVDFARTTVWVDATWTDATLRITVVDDGPGYPPQLLGRIGDPFLRQRRTAPHPDPRRDYEGMGLGLFIAKTLLERSGATVTFANGSDPFLTSAETSFRCGAIVEVMWPRDRIETEARPALGRNMVIVD